MSIRLSTLAVLLAAPLLASAEGPVKEMSVTHTTMFFKVPPGFEIPNHWHTSAERMTLSSGELTVQYEGQPAVTLKPGMYAYGPAKVPHKATCAKKGNACVLFIAFESAIDAFPVDARK